MPFAPPVLFAPTCAIHLNTITAVPRSLQDTASVPSTWKATDGWAPWPAMKASREGKVTSLSGEVDRKLIEEEVSVNLVAERMLIAVVAEKAVSREATVGR
jgi:hypothetical protein